MNSLYNSHSFVVLAYRESPYLEKCIQSVLHQSVKSHVVIATSTPNAYIQKYAEKYGLEIIINPQAGGGIGCDFDFARKCVRTVLVTVAHQDDIYDFRYAESMLVNYKKYNDALILFTDYYEIRNKKEIYSNINLRIKRLLLSALKSKKRAKANWRKRAALAFGNPICCPAVTFVNGNINQDEIFPHSLMCNVDWKAWEILSKKKGRFVYIREKLMGHRVHEGSTTTEIIHDNLRTNEDYAVLKCFWPDLIAKLIARVYSLSEKSNSN